MVGAVRMYLSPEFRRPYADSEATNRAVLLHRLSDATLSLLRNSALMPLQALAVFSSERG